MMDLLLATSGGEAQAASGGYVDDVFSAYTYTGNGGTQTINNGIDLAGKGGLVWIKNRGFGAQHILQTDTSNYLSSNLTNGNTAYSYLSSFNSIGFSLANTSGFREANYLNDTYVSWTFRKAPKFFDVVTYTGDGTSNRQIAHSLGVAPWILIVKRMDGAGSWRVFHASIGANKVIFLEDTSAAVDDTGGGNWGGVSPTASLFTTGAGTNIAGATYVAYLFAHDPSADGIIQCGSFTTDGSGNATVNLGWEPQFSIIKSVSASGNWDTVDAARGWNASTDAVLSPNLASAEVSANRGAPTSTGFSAAGLAAGTTYIYLAIRRQNKPPTSGTQVYNAIARTGTGAAATVTGVGFAPDMAITKKRSSATLTGARFVDRLRGATRWLDSSATTVETVTADTVTGLDNMDGFVLGADATTSAFNTNTHTYINHFFKRAPGFFDVVCYTGTSVARTVPHNLGVAPELMIVKNRTSTTDWKVYSASVGATKAMSLNYTAIPSQNSWWWADSAPTASSFYVGVHPTVNDSGFNYVAYIFATLLGISKVGSYTGNGTSQTINCGFATGVRFILIKRTDATGDWYVWDSVRGIIAANDPYLSLNTAAAEVTTDDSVDPEASGFIVNQNTATNINVNGGQYIFLAIA